METITTTCSSSDEKVALFSLIIETNNRLTKDFAAALESSCQLPLAWFEVLLQLSHTQDGRLKMTQMADAIFHSTGGTTRLIDRLEEATFVRREHCPSDRRAVWVTITEAGNAKLNEAFGVHLNFLDELMRTRLSSDDRDQLRELLTKLND